ncbi:MAG TPA: hypothetical protein VGK53_09780 [Propionicimonas sp.]
MTEVDEALRRWAKGLNRLEASAELLIRACDGRFASPGQPWVQQGDDPGWWWIDVEQMTEDNYAALSGGETRLLRVAASLLGGPPLDLGRNLAGLDREHAHLVLAAIAHASGSHEHTGRPVPDPQGRYVDQNGVRMSFERLGSLCTWPAPDTS